MSAISEAKEIARFILAADEPQALEKLTRSQARLLATTFLRLTEHFQNLASEINGLEL